MRIPALIGKGAEGYTSLDQELVIGLDGTPLAEASITSPVLLRSFARSQPAVLRSVSVHSLLAMMTRAADIFESGAPDGLAPQAFARNVALSSGLPLTASRERTLGLFPGMLRSMARFLEVQGPGGLDLYDTNVCEKEGIHLGLVPRGRNAGFVMPGNHPAPHFMWLGALAMKMPVIVRPSADDLFTPYRLACALIDAGLPAEAVGFVPGGHELVDAIVESCAVAVLFGGEQLALRHAASPRIQVHGPGRSKVVVLANADFDRTVDLIVRLALDDAGRGCVNVSAVVVEGDAGPLAHAVAAALDQVALVSPLDEDAMLGATPPAHAAAFKGLIERGLQAGGRLLGAGPVGRGEIVEGMTVMCPAVIELPSWDHPLFGVELPFPFLVFASAASEELAAVASNSLAVAVAGSDPDLERALLLDPTIDKVLTEDAASTQFDPREPHQGLLFDFLYQKKTVRRGPQRVTTTEKRDVDSGQMEIQATL